MQEQIGQVAARIKEMRELSDISPESMASELGLSRDAYLKLESGQEDISVGLLTRIAKRCKVELATLITGEEPRLHLYTLTRRDKGASVERKVEYQYMALAANFIHKHAAPFLVTARPGGPVHPDTHAGQEFIYLLEGHLQVQIGDHEVTLEEGDSLYFDASAPHAAKALDGKPARFLAVLA
ncbi:MAG: putative transcription regulator [Holophagaceae bacterium]|nr:putative transcription regulator [Holophagaceae bacterium]